MDVINAHYVRGGDFSVDPFVPVAPTNLLTFGTTGSMDDRAFTPLMVEVNVDTNWRINGTNTTAVRLRPPIGALHSVRVLIKVPKQTEDVTFGTAWSFIDNIKLSLGDQSTVYTIDSMMGVVMSYHLAEADARDGVATAIGFDGAMGVGSYPPYLAYDFNPIKNKAITYVLDIPLPFSGPDVTGADEWENSLMVFSERNLTLDFKFAPINGAFVGEDTVTWEDVLPPTVSVQTSSWPKSKSTILATRDNLIAGGRSVSSYGQAPFAFRFTNTSTTASKYTVETRSMTGRTTFIVVWVTSDDEVAAGNTVTNYLPITELSFEATSGTERNDYEGPTRTLNEMYVRRYWHGAPLSSEGANIYFITFSLSSDMSNDMGAALDLDRSGQLNFTFERPSHDQFVDTTDYTLHMLQFKQGVVEYPMETEGKGDVEYLT